MYVMETRKYNIAYLAKIFSDLFQHFWTVEFVSFETFSYNLL